MLDPAALCSVVRQHPGQVLAGAELLNDAGAGEAVGGQDADLLGLGASVSQAADQGGAGLFKQLPLPASVQLFKVLVEERRQIHLQDTSDRSAHPLH